MLAQPRDPSYLTSQTSMVRILMNHTSYVCTLCLYLGYFFVSLVGPDYPMNCFTPLKYWYCHKAVFILG